MQEVCDLLSESGLDIQKAPFSLRDLQPVCDLRKIQLVIFSKAYGSSIVYQYPKHIDLQRQKVFLYENSALASDRSHLDCLFAAPLPNSKQFSLCCHSLFSNNILRHSCSNNRKQFRRCPRCTRLLLKPSEYWNYKYIAQFCTSNKSDVNKVEKRTCSCGTIFFDSQCMAVHQKVKKCGGGTLVCNQCDLKITSKKRKSAHLTGVDSPLEKRMKKHRWVWSRAEVDNWLTVWYYL